MPIDLAASIADDFEIFDGVQTVTVMQGVTTDSVAGVATSPLSRKQLEMVGGLVGLEGQFKRFSLPVANLSVTPKQGNTITDASSIVWTIVSADLNTLSTRWLCVGQRQK